MYSDDGEFTFRVRRFSMIMNRTLAAAIAAATLGAGSAAYAQSDQTSPPPSQDMRESNPPSQTTPPDDSTSGSSSSRSPGAAGQSGSDEATATAAPIDQKKVEQFADAYVQVQTIQQKANSELQTASDPAKADEVKSAAQSEMIAAVERSGLEIQEFNQIVASMAADNELRSRVSAEVQKRVGGENPGGGT
jgi:hypothetical protein